jgi:hypothetical protein
MRFNGSGVPVTISTVTLRTRSDLGSWSDSGTPKPTMRSDLIPMVPKPVLWCDLSFLFSVPFSFLSLFLSFVLKFATFVSLKVECAFGKLKGQWRCLHNGIKTRDPAAWNDIILCCCTLHNVTIAVSGAGWDWDAGVVHGYSDPSDRAAFGGDPDSVSNNPFERLRDDDRVKAKRYKLMDELVAQGWKF